MGFPDVTRQVRLKQGWTWLGRCDRKVSVFKRRAALRERGLWATRGGLSVWERVGTWTLCGVRCRAGVTFWKGHPEAVLPTSAEVTGQTHLGVDVCRASLGEREVPASRHGPGASMGCGFRWSVGSLLCRGRV